MHPLIRAFWKGGVMTPGAYDGADYIIATAEKGRG
jgi:hypothetical protein